VKRDISQRWVLSFADLTLLLLAFFIMMQAQAGDRLKLVAGMRGAFGSGEDGAKDSLHGFAAAAIFEPGEAILKRGEARSLEALGAASAKAGQRVLVASQGRDGQSERLDSWELAAARTTAVARALRRGGLRDTMIDVAIPPMRASDAAKGQRITVQQLAAARR